MKENKNLYLRLGIKKIYDMKIKTKLPILFFLVTVASCGIIGLFSYRIASSSVIENSQVMSINWMKQVGLNLDERMESFHSMSY